MNHESINNITPPTERFEELERTCFVIMPFGKKKVGGKTVDFTAIYKKIFEPAIGKVTTPEGKNLIAARTDMDAFSGSINQEMFEYIMYSRLAFADISGFNPNVFYEIGARHSAQESGTVLFRQTGHDIPFDIKSIKIFEYDHHPAEKAETSCKFISSVISESLKRNRLDSPVRLALRAQWGGNSSLAGEISPEEQPIVEKFPGVNLENEWRKKEIERFLLDAEEAIRVGDLEMAQTNYWAALRFDPMNIIARMRLGLLMKRKGSHYKALEEFNTITKLAPNYGEAWREKGVVEGLIARMIPKEKREKTGWLPDGYESLKRATMLIPDDFDAWSSLGGVLKNVRGELAEATKMYNHAAAISDSHPYPLLNSLKLQALHTGKLDVKSIRGQLIKAEEMRMGQSQTVPPTDTPWCYFDLAEIRLYRRDRQGFLDFVEMGIESCQESWQPKTFRDSLHDTLVAKEIYFDGLDEGIALLDKAIDDYKKK